MQKQESSAVGSLLLFAELTQSCKHKLLTRADRGELKYRLIISDRQGSGVCVCVCHAFVSGPFWPRSACLLNGCWGQSGRSGNEALWDELSGGRRRSSASSEILRQSGGQSDNTTVHFVTLDLCEHVGRRKSAAAGWVEAAASM